MSGRGRKLAARGVKGVGEGMKKIGEAAQYLPVIVALNPPSLRPYQRRVNRIQDVELHDKARARCIQDVELRDEASGHHPCQVRISAVNRVGRVIANSPTFPGRTGFLGTCSELFTCFWLKAGCGLPRAAATVWLRAVKAGCGL